MTVALVVIDVQNGILHGNAEAERQAVMDAVLDETAARLAALQAKAREAGVPVIVVQHDDPPGSGSRLEVGTPGWELRPEIAPKAGDVLVNKRACDSFFETDLADCLGEHAVSTLVIGGCMTQFCVDTTVRRAVSLGYDVTLVADGHMTADRGALTFEQIIAHHNATLDGFDAGAHVATVRPAAEVAF
jgi:nicotinamidase-related amidase